MEDDLVHGISIEQSLWGVFEKGLLESLIYGELKLLFAKKTDNEEFIQNMKRVLDYEKVLKYEWLFEREFMVLRFQHLLSNNN